MTTQEACKLVKSGNSVIFGGNALRAHPMVVIRELIRQKINDLHVVGFANGLDLDILVGAGCVKKVSSAYIGLEVFGLAPNFRRAVEKEGLEVVDYPEIIERFVAAAWGMPFVPNLDLFGTDTLNRHKEIKIGTSPLSGEKYAALPPAHADVAIIHAPMGDKYGNILYKQRKLMTTEEDLWFSRCADKLIVSVERIVDHKYVRRNPHMNMIPHYRTDAVVWAPYGSHPGAFDYFYDYDRPHLEQYVEAAKTPETFKNYLAKYVYGVKDHDEYLNEVGPVMRLLQLQNAEVFFL